MPDQPATPAPRTITPLRIILGVVLVVAVAAYIYDYSVRSQRQAAFEAASKLLPSEDNPPVKFSDADISPENIRKAMGRDPAKSTKTDNSLEETYVWQGILRPHAIRVRYTIGFVKGSTPLATSIEPE